MSRTVSPTVKADVERKQQEIEQLSQAAATRQQVLDRQAAAADAPLQTKRASDVVSTKVDDATRSTGKIKRDFNLAKRTDDAKVWEDLSADQDRNIAQLKAVQREQQQTSDQFQQNTQAAQPQQQVNVGRAADQNAAPASQGVRRRATSDQEDSQEMQSMAPRPSLAERLRNANTGAAAALQNVNQGSSSLPPPCQQQAAKTNTQVKNDNPKKTSGLCSALWNNKGKILLLGGLIAATILTGGIAGVVAGIGKGLMAAFHWFGSTGAGQWVGAKATSLAHTPAGHWLASKGSALAHSSVGHSIASVATHAGHGVMTGAHWLDAKGAMIGHAFTSHGAIASGIHGTVAHIGGGSYGAGVMALEAGGLAAGSLAVVGLGAAAAYHISKGKVGENITAKANGAVTDSFGKTGSAMTRMEQQRREAEAPRHR